MPMQQADFERQVEEALAAHFSGWDFSWLHDKLITTPLQWDYPQLAQEAKDGALALLDMETGGGEFLSKLLPLPPDTCATENYPPNVPIARKNLEPLGVQVFDADSEAPLPFEGARFDVVLNRHGSYLPEEIFRILKPGGVFITQQVGGDNMTGLNQLLQKRPHYMYADCQLDPFVTALKQAGMRVERAEEAHPPARFLCIGALIYYFKAIPWQIKNFSVKTYRKRLMALHEQILRDGYLEVLEHRFLIIARKP